MCVTRLLKKVRRNAEGVPVYRNLLCAAVAVFMLTGCYKKDEKHWTRVPGTENETARQPMNFEKQNSSDTGTGLKASSGANPHTIAAPPPIDVKQTSGSLYAAGIGFEISKDWQKQTPANKFRLAQYSLPGQAGPAELVVSAFGQGQGGDAKANVDRWVGQFKPEDPTTSATTTADVANFQQDGLNLFLVRTAGTYDAGMMGAMMGMAAEPKPHYALFGIVVEGGPQGTVFIKAIGPSTTIEAQGPKLERMARSVHRSK